MKRTMLVFISVVMLFAACKEPSTEPNVYEENFNSITFGMTKEEVITILGKEPDDEFEHKDGYSIWYYGQIFFDVTARHVYYSFDDNGNLDFILAFYNYYDESEKEQMPIDLEHVKEELIKYYPDSKLTYISEQKDNMIFHTENRIIALRTYDDAFDVTIKTRN